MANSPQTTRCESRNQQRCQMVCEGWGVGSDVNRRGNCWVFGWDKGWCGQHLDWISFKRPCQEESQFFWSFKKNLYSLPPFEDLKLSCNIDSFWCQTDEYIWTQMKINSFVNTILKFFKSDSYEWIKNIQSIQVWFLINNS